MLRIFGCGTDDMFFGVSSAIGARVQISIDSNQGPARSMRHYGGKVVSVPSARNRKSAEAGDIDSENRSSLGLQGVAAKEDSVVEPSTQRPGARAWPLSAGRTAGSNRLFGESDRAAQWRDCGAV